MLKDGETPIFVIGLTMAGAISAGAYTAGVLDFLFRAMKAHNDRVSRGPTEADPNPPRHKVMLKVITGASAGGMCTGLTMGSLIEAGGATGAGWSNPNPLSYDSDTASVFSSYVLAPLYEAWVEKITLWDGDRGLLGLEDLDSSAASLDAAALGPMADRPVSSALNGLHLDQVAGEALAQVTAWSDPDGTARVPYDFLASDLDLFLTTTALNGTVYQVTFQGDGDTADDQFTMEQHGIARHFRLDGLGQMVMPSGWLDIWQDAGITLDLDTQIDGKVPFCDAGNAGNWLALTVAALATGAFPGGLMPRYVAANAGELGMIGPDGVAQGGALPIDIPAGSQVSSFPVFPDGYVAQSQTPYVSVDGGTINNEPFELARFTLRERDDTGRLLANPRKSEDADRAVLMIDPFPEGAVYKSLDVPGATLLASLHGSLKKLLPTLISQARFKPAEIVQARNTNVRSRFLISPSRRAGPLDGVDRLTGAAAISSGALGGFGGFFDHGFRKHDFILGQRNCQRFLSAHFTVAAHNQVLALDPNLNAGVDEADWDMRPIIDPGWDNGDHNALTTPMASPDWPVISSAALRKILAQGRVRIERAGAKLVDYPDLSFLRKVFLGRVWSGVFLVWTGGVKKMAIEGAARAVLSDFIRRGQHETYADLTQSERYVLVTLIEVGGDYVTAKQLMDHMKSAQRHGEIPAEFRLPDRDVTEAILAEFEDKNWVTHRFFSLGKPKKYRFKLEI